MTVPVPAPPASLIEREPVQVVAWFKAGAYAVMGVLAAFDVADLTNEQESAVLGLAVLVEIGSAVWARRRVTPNTTVARLVEDADAQARHPSRFLEGRAARDPRHGF